jgi:myo-inositol 2-dehydrogenase/D-chiro-inositol 1-dehydrogenase/scyllo-inositol 2-dehydrogenase (NAD+)
MAMNTAECDDMLSAAARHNVKLQIGFMRRFDQGFREAKQRVEGGEIGDVVLVKSLTHGPSTPKEWMYDLDKSNGPLAEVNSHDIDTLRWFSGSEFREVFAIGANYRCPDARERYPDFYDNVCLLASFSDGKQGFIGGAVAARYGYDARVEIVGTRGVLFAGSPGGREAMSCSPEGEVRGPAIQSWRDLFRDAYLAEDRAFVDCILEGKEPQVTGIDGRMAVAVVNAGNRSIRTGKPVLLEDIL